jgi:hypothetical protein
LLQKTLNAVILQKAFNQYLDQNPDYPWSNCDAAVIKAKEIAKTLGITTTSKHFNPTKLHQVTYPDLNPNHVWLQINQHYYDPKTNSIYHITNHPYQPECLIQNLE